MPAIAAIIARHLKEGAEVGLGLAEVLDQRDPVDRLLQPPQAKASVFGRTAAEARGKAVSLSRTSQLLLYIETPVADGSGEHSWPYGTHLHDRR